MSNINKKAGIQPAVRKEFSVRDAALAGDIVMVINPETVNRDATTSAWDRNVRIEIQTASGLTHDWLSADYATTLSIADTGGGTATIDSTTLEIRGGKAIVIVHGDEATWAAAENDTLTVANITILGVTVIGGTSVQTFV
ncbi:MAG: hypothetical protein ACTSPI_04720 [Candidatus Heimdallarchaeaceae archaeon]